MNTHARVQNRKDDDELRGSTNQDVARYIYDLLGSLQRIAERRNLIILGHLLSLARIEAQHMSRFGGSATR